eukprot:4409111-Amphidinium_carterae.1
MEVDEESSSAAAAAAPESTLHAVLRVRGTSRDPPVPDTILPGGSGGDGQGNQSSKRKDVKAEDVNPSG